MTRTLPSATRLAQPEHSSSKDLFIPEAGFRFLAQLKRNNSRDWFNDRKSEYKESVHEPMEALVHAVAAACRAKRISLFAKEKNPVMRVYRDVRFSKNKAPYKTHVSATLSRSFRDSQVVLYLHFSPAESLVAAGVWQPERPLLQTWREQIAGHPDRFTRIVSKLNSKGLTLSTEDSLAVMPRGFTQYAASPIAPFLKLTSFIAVRTLEPGDCTRPGLVQRAVEFAVAAKPLLEFGWDLEANAPSPPTLL